MLAPRPPPQTAPEHRASICTWGPGRPSQGRTPLHRSPNTARHCTSCHGALPTPPFGAQARGSRPSSSPVVSRPVWEVNPSLRCLARSLRCSKSGPNCHTPCLHSRVQRPAPPAPPAVGLPSGPGAPTQGLCSVRLLGGFPTRLLEEQVETQISVPFTLPSHSVHTQFRLPNAVTAPCLWDHPAGEPPHRPHLSLLECSRASSRRFCLSHSRRALSCSSRCRFRRSCSRSFSLALACLPGEGDTRHAGAGVHTLNWETSRKGQACN